MRLTLRTLLAHLDDVLDPQDSEQLKVKIKEATWHRRLSNESDREWFGSN